MNHKILAWVMALVLVVSLMPTAALAAGDSEIDEWETPEAGTEGEWTAEDNYDISWYTDADPGATTFTLSDAADLAGLAVIVNGKDATGNSVTATMGGENGAETTQTIQDSFEGKTIKLTDNAEIDLSGKTWTPIGKDSERFQGTFDGNSESGTTITGLTIKTTGIDAGLFGVVKEATIKNVAVENADIDVTLSMHDTVGGIVGLADGKTANTKSSGSISNCTFSGTIKVNSDNSISTYGSYAGGIVGSNGKNGNNANYPGLTVENCTNNGTITGNAVYMGGIVGANGYQDTVKNCTNQGEVTCTRRGNSYSTGGIAGVTYGDIEKCTNEAAVTIEDENERSNVHNMGGIVGTMYSCKVSNCSNEGAISSGSVYNIGGIAGLISFSGSNTTAEISSCQNTRDITGSDYNLNTVHAGGIVGVASESFYSNTTISITKCSNSGDIKGSGKLEPYLGGIVGIGGGSGFTLSQCYNSGAVCAEKANTATNSGIGGLVGSLRGGTVSSSYNVGAVTNQMSQAGPAGGLVGDVRNGSVELSDCYNVGTVSATNSSAPTGGIVGQLGYKGSLTATNCSYWDECVQTNSTSYGTSRTANQMTEDNLWNDESHLGLSTGTWEKTDNNLSDANNLIGYLPVLTNNKQIPAPELKRTAKKDQDDLTISGKLNGENLESNGQLPEGSGPVQLTATGGSSDGAITWAVVSTGDIQASIDESGKVTFTGHSGTVTVTATRAGNDEYNSVSATYSFTVYPTTITEVKIIDLKAPVQGEEPVMELSVPDDAHYSVLREADLGGSYRDVSWQEGGNTFSGTFKQDKTYTVTIRVKAEVPYSFADEANLTIALEGVKETAYSSLTATKDDSGQLVITVVFEPTDHTHNWDEENWSSDAIHHWHACLNDGCPLIGNDYAEHIDDGNGICSVCGATIGYLITFNANSGTCDTESVHTNVKGLLSELPVPTRGGYTFLGWFTATSGGEQVTADTAFTEDMTVYAQWKSNSSGSPTRYPVTVEDSAHGQVKSNPASAKRGETVTITVTPDEGYETASVTVTGQNGNPVAVTDHGDGTYSFTQPASKVTVSAAFVCNGLTDHCPSYHFADVDTSAWYHLAVDFAVENGITNGTSATTFGPDLACTRGQMVTFLWRAAGSPAPENAANPFTDLVEGAYYYDAVLWATGEGITLGTSATTFSPEATVTRGQAVTFLWRQAGSPLASGTLPFADVDAGAYYAGAVGWAAGEGIALGTSAATFSPENPCTRAQIVTFLYRATV